MKVLHATLAWVCSISPLGAVYAPIPEFAKGRALTASITASVFHDDNIFGAGQNEIDSVVYRVAPSIALNASLTDQTFLSASYGLTADYIADRPGEHDLYSHLVQARVAHSFSAQTSLEVIEAYTISRNPEALLAGVPLNTDQSLKSNQLDARFTSNLSERLGYSLHGRSTTFAYDSAVLAASLDRHEVQFGGSAFYLIQRTLKAVGEYRYLDVGYDTAGQLKDKDSQYFLAGLDYAPGPRTVLSARVGLEDRQRKAAPDDQAPYAELSARYAYGALSYVSAGYVSAYEETSNLSLYTDTHVNRFYVSVQHALRPTLIASGTVTYEPSELQGRPGISPDRDETITRAGVALTYIPGRRWSVSATLDRDNIDSDDPVREYERTRIGISGRYVF